MSDMSPLSSIQAAERDIVIQSGEFWTAKIGKATRGSDVEGGSLWEVADTDGMTFGGFFLPDGREPPMVGDVYRLYGCGRSGWGGSITGGDLRGVPCWFKSRAELAAAKIADAAKAKDRKAKAWEASRDATLADYAALPEPLRLRVDRFVDNCPVDWWPEFGGYEMAGLKLAVAMADHLAGADDPVAAVKAFMDLDYKEQVAALPAMEQMSGNLAGYAAQTAIALMGLPDEKSYRFLVESHGAMVPLVGCIDYGCAHAVAA